MSNTAKITRHLFNHLNVKYSVASQFALESVCIKLHTHSTGSEMGMSSISLVEMYPRSGWVASKWMANMVTWCEQLQKSRDKWWNSSQSNELNSTQFGSCVATYIFSSLCLVIFNSLRILSVYGLRLDAVSMAKVSTIRIAAK